MQVSMIREKLAYERIEKKKKVLAARWFLFGYVLGSAVVAALLQIF